MSVIDFMRRYHMKKLIIVVIIILALAGAAGFFYTKYWDKGADELDEAVIEAILEDSSDITTQHFLYTDVNDMQAGTIPLINKDKYLIKYKADVTAGFDISKTEIEMTDNKIKVIIPHAKIQDVNIRAEDVELIDTNFSIIEGGKEATLEALAKAEADARKSAKKAGLLDNADKNSINIMKGLLKSVAGDREIEVDFK